VKRNDFHEYKLTVANEVDSATVQFTLVEGKYLYATVFAARCYA